MRLWAYQTGDAIARDGVYGIVLNATKRLACLRLIGVQSGLVEWSAPNLSVRQYLKLVKSRTDIHVQNLTLEDELKEAHQQGNLKEMIDGNTDS